MSQFSLAIGRPTLADRVFARGLVMDLVLIVSGAALTAVAAQIAVPLYPVPVTGQTLAVLLVGASLGALRGALSMVVYAAMGVVGLPVFSDASSGWSVVLGPTGGYILGFILSAALTGWIAQRAWDRRIVAAFLSFTAGTVVTFAVGLPWLAAVLQLSVEQTIASGLLPFIPGGIIKALLAAAILTLTWRALGSDEGTRRG